ncbi:MAG: hypothetical protein EAZ18_01530 [Oscillatoriales cyanobacterium]|nr:MAG: hypothetical protein EAZ18_01530 [Oscillatoriales cyanobacterium]
MHELDRLLQELVSQAQLYPKNTDPRRRKIIPQLWDIMFPGSSLRRDKKTTDDEAKRRLAGIKKRYRDRYLAILEGDFENDWLDVLQTTQKEILNNINIFNKGVDSKLYQAWLKFSETSPSQRTPEVYSEFNQQVERFRRSFVQRRTNKQTQTYPPEKAQPLAQSCKNLCQNIQNSDVDLQQTWNTFCDEVQQLYRPLKFWNWFARYLQFRFIDIIRKRLNVISGDAPAAQQDDDSANETRFDRIQTKADSRPSPEVIRMIYKDPDGIFTGKHIRNFPDVNFRALVILKFKEASLKEIQEHFGNRVNAQTTISPFYTRTCSYFKPIIEEYLEARLALSQSAIEQIVTDSEGKYNRRRMPDEPKITFKGIIRARLEGVQSWTILARQLQVNVTELIYFYLDGISSFQLIPKPQKRTRRNKNNTED